MVGAEFLWLGWWGGSLNSGDPGYTGTAEGEVFNYFPPQKNKKIFGNSLNSD